MDGILAGHDEKRPGKRMKFLNKHPVNETKETLLVIGQCGYLVLTSASGRREG
jgi:hypothetical protein